MKLIFIKKKQLNICLNKVVPKYFTKNLAKYYKGEHLYYQIVAQNLLQRDSIGSRNLKLFNKKDAFKCFTTITGKHLWQSLFLVALQVFSMPFI